MAVQQGDRSVNPIAVAMCAALSLPGLGTIDPAAASEPGGAPVATTANRQPYKLSQRSGHCPRAIPRHAHPYPDIDSWNELNPVPVNKAYSHSQYGQIQQVGSDNDATLKQKGQYNIANTEQSGAGNRSQIVQSGTGNRSVNYQRGINNRFVGIQHGWDNTINYGQSGTNLSIVVKQYGIGKTVNVWQTN